MRAPYRMRAASGFALIVALAGIVALATAFTLQYGFGQAPCHLCLLERWPWGLVIVTAGGGALAGRPRLGLALAAIALLAGAGLSAYHVAVEQGWLALPASCVAGGQAKNLEDLRAQLMNARPTCDRVAVGVLGLSLATWNLVASLAGLAVAVAGALNRTAGRPARRSGAAPFER